MAHVFISYSTRNSDYAQGLTKRLLAEGFDVWIDNDRLRSSEDWWQSIVLAIRDCAAFVVIMTPESDGSRWVQREITLADKYEKPIFPLLAAGSPDTPNWEIFVRTQIEDARTDQLPGPPFFEKLAAIVAPQPRPGQNVTAQVAGTPAQDDEFMADIAAPPPPDSISQNTLKWSRRRWAALLVIGAAELVLVGLFVMHGAGDSTVDMNPTQQMLALTETIDPRLSAQDYFNRGEAQRLSNAFEAAIAEYTRALDLDPADVLAYDNRGHSYFALGDYEQAIADYGRAIDLEPAAIRYNDRGNAYFELSLYDQAIADYTTALDHNPDYGLVYNNRGNTYFALSDYAAAMEDYTAAIDHDPNNALLYVNRGNTHFELGDYTQAIADYTTALEHNPDYATAYNNRANTYRRLEDYDLAFADYAQAIDRDPSFALPHWGLADTYYALEDYDQALQAYHRYVDLAANPASSVLDRIDELEQTLRG